MNEPRENPDGPCTWPGYPRQASAKPAGNTATVWDRKRAERRNVLYRGTDAHFARKWPFVVILLPLGLCGCFLLRLGYEDRLQMEPRIHALDGINTPHDDFNATPAPPPFYMNALLVFAGNAASSGERFQIDFGRLEIVQKPFHSRRDRRPPPPLVKSERTGRFPAIPERPRNQRGPSALISTGVSPRPHAPPAEHAHHFSVAADVGRMPLAPEDDDRLGDVVWMFDSDAEGRRNLYYVDAEGAARPFFGNRPDADDAYAAYDFERDELLFCSNRSGRYEIYRVRNPSRGAALRDWLGDAALADRIERVGALVAEGDSMAPFVEDDWLVFASDRPGGRGGFDLYVSRWRDGDWEAPRNLQDLMPDGVELNTRANEFRPSLLQLSLFHASSRHRYRDLRVLVFSSDRPGGKGGYDLYLTALPEEG